MFRRNKEIFYGIAFGLGAAVIDTLMDAREGNIGFSDELTQHPVMVLYRGGFVLFGLLLGWLLWRDRKRERDFRQLSETLERLRQECAKHAFLMHAKLQILLMRDDLRLPQEAHDLIRLAYQGSQQLQTTLRETPPA